MDNPPVSMGMVEWILADPGRLNNPHAAAYHLVHNAPEGPYKASMTFVLELADNPVATHAQIADIFALAFQELPSNILDVLYERLKGTQNGDALWASLLYALVDIDRGAVARWVLDTTDQGDAQAVEAARLLSLWKEVQTVNYVLAITVEWNSLDAALTCRFITAFLDLPEGVGLFPALETELLIDWVWATAREGGRSVEYAAALLCEWHDIDTIAFVFKTALADSTIQKETINQLAEAVLALLQPGERTELTAKLSSP